MNHALLAAFLKGWRNLDLTAVRLEKLAADLYLENPEQARKLHAGLALAVARAEADASWDAEHSRDDLPRDLSEYTALELSRLSPEQLERAEWERKA